MIKLVYFVKPFEPTAAVALIAITTLIGYVFGFLAPSSGTGSIVANQSAKNALRLPSNAEPAGCRDFMLCA